MVYICLEVCLYHLCASVSLDCAVDEVVWVVVCKYMVDVANLHLVFYFGSAKVL